LRIQALSKGFNVDRLLVATAVLTEVCRAYPWLLLLSGLSIRGWSEPPISFLSTLVVITAVTALLSISLSRGLHLAEVRIATLSVGMILILLLTRLENGGVIPFGPEVVRVCLNHIRAACRFPRLRAAPHVARHHHR